MLLISFVIFSVILFNCESSLFVVVETCSVVLSFCTGKWFLVEIPKGVREGDAEGGRRRGKRARKHIGIRHMLD